jgi:hypothetical protein
VSFGWSLLLSSSAHIVVQSLRGASPRTGRTRQRGAQEDQYVVVTLGARGRLVDHFLMETHAPQQNLQRSISQSKMLLERSSLERIACEISQVSRSRELWRATDFLGGEMDQMYPSSLACLA